MSKTSSAPTFADRKAYLVTGPTSGIGRATALELAKYGTVILVGRDPRKLEDMQKTIEQKGQHAVVVVCDLSDISSVQRAVEEVAALDLTIVGLVNNAGIRQERATKNAQGWDMTFATNHLGPFALTEALLPYLPDGANVVFIVSAVEDPEHAITKSIGYRGGRYLSAEASARGEWKPDGSTVAGADAYATSKQGNLATTLAFARETPRLHFNAVEPGVNPATGLTRDSSPLVRFIAQSVIPLFVPLLMPFMKSLNTPERAARVIAKVLLNESGTTGIYYDGGGQPMLGSVLVRDPKFQDRVVAETRALLATLSPRINDND